jgi:uncharacterized membrane protein
VDQHDVTLQRRKRQLDADLAAMEAVHPADVPVADLEAAARNLVAAVALAQELKEST